MDKLQEQFEKEHQGIYLTGTILDKSDKIYIEWLKEKVKAMEKENKELKKEIENEN